jgi:hypothetical protein
MRPFTAELALEPRRRRDIILHHGLGMNTTRFLAPFIIAFVAAAWANAQTALDRKPQGVPPLLSEQPRRTADPKAIVWLNGGAIRLHKIMDVRGDQIDFLTTDARSVTFAWSTLPPQARAAFTAEREQAIVEKEQRAQAELDRLAGVVSGSGHVLRIMRDGMLVTFKGKVILLRGHPLAREVADGDLINFRGTPDGLFRYIAGQDGEATVRAYRSAE